MSRHHAAINRRAWARARRACFRRDGYRCRRCGRPGRLEAHHVKPLDKGGAALDVANLIALCRYCHIRDHKIEKPMHPERRAWVDLLESNMR